MVNGCTDPTYTEYDASANTDNGSCTSVGLHGPSLHRVRRFGQHRRRYTTPVVNGCTDPTYTDYNVTDDCTTPVVEGCTDPAYTEYGANTDDGSCTTPVRRLTLRNNESRKHG